MKIFIRISLIVLCTVSICFSQSSSLDALHFLLGEWNAAGGGNPGEGSGGFAFTTSLQNHVILRTNHAEYPERNGKPAYRHEDLMVIYLDTDSLVKADFFDGEGHVIRYMVTSPAPGEVVFLGQASATAPRYRLTYKLRSDATLNGGFDIAPPGKPDAFASYLTWTAHKVERPDSGPK